MSNPSAGNQEKAVRHLRNAINYLFRHYGGIEAAFILMNKLKEIMPFERPELRVY